MCFAYLPNRYFSDSLAANFFLYERCLPGFLELVAGRWGGGGGSGLGPIADTTAVSRRSIHRYFGGEPAAWGGGTMVFEWSGRGRGVNGRLLAVIGGDYTAVQSVSGCVSAVSAPFRVDPVGIRSVLDPLEPLIYPNPVQNSLDWVRLYKVLDGRGMYGPFEAKVLGMNGAVVASNDDRGGEPRLISDVVIGGLSPGIYLLVVMDSRGEKALFRFLKA